MVDFLISLRGTPLEAHSVDVLADVEGVVSSHCLVDGRMPFFFLNTTHFCKSIAGPRLENKDAIDSWGVCVSVSVPSGTVFKYYAACFA